MRLIANALIFFAIWLFGWYVLGIHPSLAEALLIIIACAVSDAISEAL